MAKIKYTTKENTKTGKHSFYAVPIPTGKLTFEELCEEACSDNTFGVEEMKGCVSKFMKAVQREALRGWRCELGTNFLTIYPNIEASVKDYVDPETHQTVVATAKMVTANNAKSRLGCTVHKKFSALFAQEVSWQKVNADGSDIEEEEDITQNNENVEGGGDNTGGNNNGGGGNPGGGMDQN